MKACTVASLMIFLVFLTANGVEFANLDFENMGTDSYPHYYTATAWSIQYGTYPDKLINSWNLGFASEAYLQRGNIDYSFDPALASLNGIILGGNSSYFLWGALPENGWYHVDPSIDPSALEFQIADLYQTGRIPTWANSVTFDYRNDRPSFFLNNELMPLVEIAPGKLAASVTEFQGLETELRFRANKDVRTMFDNIAFSPSVIPEPGTGVLGILALALLVYWRPGRG